MGFAAGLSTVPRALACRSQVTGYAGSRHFDTPGAGSSPAAGWPCCLRQDESGCGCHHRAACAAATRAVACALRLCFCWPQVHSTPTYALQVLKDQAKAGLSPGADVPCRCHVLPDTFAATATSFLLMSLTWNLACTALPSNHRAAQLLQVAPVYALPNACLRFQTGIAVSVDGLHSWGAGSVMAPQSLCGT